MAKSNAGWTASTNVIWNSGPGQVIKYARTKKRRSRKKAKKPVAMDPDLLPDAITNTGKHEKIWLRPKEQEYKLWKSASFLSDVIFILPPKGNAKSHAMYHICHETEQHVIFDKVDQKKGWCSCGYDVPDEFLMVVKLQKIKR